MSVAIAKIYAVECCNDSMGSYPHESNAKARVQDQLDRTLNAGPRLPRGHANGYAGASHFPVSTTLNPGRVGAMAPRERSWQTIGEQHVGGRISPGERRCFGAA